MSKIFRAFPSGLVAFATLLFVACEGVDSGAPRDAAAQPSPTRTAPPATDHSASPMTLDPNSVPSNPDAPSNHAVATLGAGCYWCIEAVLQQVDGVVGVRSGFMGGDVPNPTYRAVCSGTTGHAEVVEVTFDPAVLPYEHLLAWFFKLHDPTTLNRQGADVGTQYRSAIFTHSDEQAAAARRALEVAQSEFRDPIVTEITPASEFYVADDDHQDYYQRNKQQGYCRAVIAPKLEKLGLED